MRVKVEKANAGGFPVQGNRKSLQDHIKNVYNIMLLTAAFERTCQNRLFYWIACMIPCSITEAVTRAL